MNQHDTLLPRAQAPEETESVDFHRYLRIVRKRLWIIAAVVALGVTLAVLYTMRQPRIYQATAKVQIDPQPPQVFGSQVQEVIQLGTGSYWSNQEYYNTQIEILSSYELSKKTVEKFNLHLNPTLMPPIEGDTRSEEQLIEGAAALISHSIFAEQQSESRIIKVKARHTDPDTAVLLANYQVETYAEYVLGLRQTGTEDASKFLTGERDNAERALRESEEELYKFKQEADILSVSLEDKQNILASDIGRYTAALSDARIKRIELGAVRTRAQGLEGEDVLESPIFALASGSAAASALKEQYVREKHRLAELSQELGPRHPGYQSQEKKVAELLQAIEREAKRAMRELDERYQAAVSSERQFQGEVDRLKEEAFALGPKAVEYNKLQREVKNNEQNYDLVMGRLSTSQISARNENTNVHSPSKARHAGLVSPRLKLNLAVALVMSLMLGFGLAFFLDYLDRTLKSSDDVEAAVGAPLLGIIPVVEDPDDAAGDPKRARDLWVHHKPKSVAAEHCRSIRTNIMFSGVERPLKSLTISSPKPNEGKTTSTIYLGTTMAQSKQRVLLVDADMRKPRLFKSLGVSEHSRGLSDVIIGEVELDDVIQKTEIDGLEVLPCGARPPNPAELLLSEKFHSILAELEKRYDRVLFDSPPLLAVTDAVVLARLCDGVIMVAQAGKTSMDDAGNARRKLADVDAHLVGVILNDMDLSDRGYGYYYYSYSYADDKAGPSGGGGGGEPKARQQTADAA